MAEPIKYRHSFNAGDLITVLPGMKNLFKQTGRKALIYQRLGLPADYSHDDNHPVTKDGRKVCMNGEVFFKLKPLIESQDYVEKFEIWEGQPVDFDYDLTRREAMMPLPGGDIHYWPTLIFPQLEPILNEPWLYAGFDNKYSNKVIINRTERYQNPYISYFFLKDNPDNLLFVGTSQEHKLFCDQWKIDIPHEQFSNINDLATAISSCKLFIGNQSLCWHIADAMKVNRILELCIMFPNTFPTGEGGCTFVKQEAFEYYYNKFLKQ